MMFRQSPLSRRLRLTTLYSIALCSIVNLQLVPACLGQTTATDAASKKENKVLRHAVFFKFKDGTSKSEVKDVVEAFRALPTKIQEIREFQLGANINKKDTSGGLTHCFLLTFADEQGRAAYLPHPDHKAFGNVLRPHLDQVFVIDYWGRPQEKPPKKALKHAVFFKFKEGSSDADMKAVEDGLAGLPAKIGTIKGFEWGKNNSPEKHDQGFTHCFMFTFDSEDGLKRYVDDPAHVAAANDLRPKMEKIRVIDFWAEEVPVKNK